MAFSSSVNVKAETHVMILHTTRKFVTATPTSVTDRQTDTQVKSYCSTSSCARSARFATCARSSLRSFCHCANIVCCGVVHRCSHQHIYVLHDDKLVTRYKDASEHNRDCNWNSSAHVQGRRQLDLVEVYVINTYLHVCIVIHTHAHY